MKTKEQIVMKTNQQNYNARLSPYALLVRSQDKKRSLVEITVYGLFILSVLAAILQFAGQPVLFGA
jgi:hypothetical protein